MTKFDPILTEIHDVREKLARTHGYDIHKIARHLKEEETKLRGPAQPKHVRHGRRLVSA